MIALLIGACVGPSGIVDRAAPSASVGPTPSSAIEPSPTAPSLAPTHSPSPSPSPITESWYPWLPPIDTSVEAVFRVDSFVAARSDVVPVSETPGGPPFRYNMGDPDPSNDPLLGFPRGGPLVVLHGPVVVDGVQWYLLTTAQLAFDIPTGWSPLSKRDGTPHFQRRTFDCPESPTTTAQLSEITLTDGFPPCYGDSEITIVGDLRCDLEADSFVTGATWLADGRCAFDFPLSVYGLKPHLRPGPYAVTGHFLDEQARDCRSLDGDASALGRLQAVLHCRRAFVATSADPA